MELFIATKNKGKIREFERMLKPFGIKIKTLYDTNLDDIEETGVTIYENALIKAKAGFETTSLLTLADDSGLEVDFLNGEPGVYSARYGGTGKSDKDRIDFLLKNMEDATNANQRTARFKTCLVLYGKDGFLCDFNGEWNGEILKSAIGGNGFGYDSIFFDVELQKSAAQLTNEEKSLVSHRGKAIGLFLNNLPGIIEKYGVLSNDIKKELLRLSRTINLSAPLSHPLDYNKAVDVLKELKNKEFYLNTNLIKTFLIENRWSMKSAKRLTEIAEKIQCGETLKRT